MGAKAHCCIATAQTTLPDGQVLLALAREGSDGRRASEHDGRLTPVLLKTQALDHVGDAGVEQFLHDILAGAVSAAKHAVTI